jgi:DnaD/phage-associated family protein
MKQFTGFPTKTEFTPLPNLFFSTLLPQISDIAELKTTLHLLGALYRKRGYPRFITYKELLANRSLMRSLKQETKPPEDVLHQALEMAAKRGTFLHLILDRNGAPEDAYFLNTDSDREAVAKIQNGELALAGLKTGEPIPIETEEPPDIFTDYEDNIGMITPRIADELREAEKLYPKTWIRDAIKEAVNQNKRKWSYISAILERWSSEGKESGAYQRDLKKTGPEKYIKQKYGHMFRR